MMDQQWRRVSTVVAGIGLLATGCGIAAAPGDLEHQPSRVPIGPLILGVWLPAGLDEFRFEPEDQARLEELGVNYLEWLQPTVVGDRTAEQWAMEFCDRSGMQMPVYYPPPGFTPYDKLHNWATRTEIDADFSIQLQERVTQLHQRWNASPGFHGYLIGHEDYSRGFYQALRLTVEALTRVDERPALSVGRLETYADPPAFMDAFYREGGQPNIFQHEHYVFTGDLPTTGRAFQRRIDKLVSGYDGVAHQLQGRFGRWHAIVQVHSESRDGVSYSQQKYREPTAGEIGLQAGLALSRGAAGIVYFIYSSGLEEVLDADGGVRERRTYGGLVDRQGMPTARFDAVRRLNGELQLLGAHLENLHFHGSFSSRRLLRNPLLASAASDLEFGLFGDGVVAHTALVVNRRTNEARNVEVGVGGTVVTNLLNGERLQVIDGKISVSLAPAGWNLLRIEQPEPALQDQG